MPSSNGHDTTVTHEDSPVIGGGALAVRAEDNSTADIGPVDGIEATVAPWSIYDPEKKKVRI